MGLTNVGAMVALQTLRATNSSLETVQQQVATGKAISTAKDNASVFAISKVMESDVAGFEAISQSLSLGQSTVTVASNATDQIGGLLEDIKTKIVSANEENVDRTKIQAEIDSLTGQIQGIVNTAQFNGLNLIDGSITGGQINILSSLDRDSSGAVTTRQISVATQNLSLTAGTDVAASAATNNDNGTAGVIDASAAGTNDVIEIGGFVFLDNFGGVTGATALQPDTAGLDPALAGGLAVGDQVSLTIGNVRGDYIVGEGDNTAAVVAGVKNALTESGVDTSDFTIDVNATAGVLTVTNNTNADVAFSFAATRGTGALAGLAAGTLSVADEANATNALDTVETAIQSVINAQASFGTSEKRLEIQNEFMSTLVDSFKAGIGTLVDADLEAASAKLQALQVQQQLGIQALSIANQAPQNVLALFREYLLARAACPPWLFHHDDGRAEHVHEFEKEAR